MLHQKKRGTENVEISIVIEHDISEIERSAGSAHISLWLLEKIVISSLGNSSGLALTKSMRLSSQSREIESLSRRRGILHHRNVDVSLSIYVPIASGVSSE